MLSVRYFVIPIALIVFSGCAKFIFYPERIAPTGIAPGEAIAFLLDSETPIKTHDLEEEMIRCMSKSIRNKNVVP
jgi:hypothetical protein